MKTFEEKLKDFVDELTAESSELVSVRHDYFSKDLFQITVSGYIEGNYFDATFTKSTVKVWKGTKCKEKINELLIKHGLNDTERQD